MTFYSDSQKPFKIAEVPYCPGSEWFYAIGYRPSSRTPNTEYREGELYVLPASNGMFYECITGGISGAVLPTIPIGVDKKFFDGTSEFISRQDHMVLGSGDVITTSSWAMDTDVAFDQSAIIDGRICEVRITGTPAGLKSITAVNTVGITLESGKLMKGVRTLLIPVRSI